jgi:hypothetical protein
MAETEQKPKRKRARPAKKQAGPGRPPWKPTDEQRAEVEILSAARVSELEIARRLGISHTTLRKNCLAEMTAGSSRRIADVVLAQYRAAMDGKVAAQNAFLKRADMMPAIERMARAPERTEQPEPKPEKLGKKAQAKVDAHNPDTNTSMGERMARRIAGAQGEPGEPKLH